MRFACFEQLLKDTMGLDVASVGGAVIERAVTERQQACHLKNVDAYWERLRKSDTELQELIEAVVVPETWFFRDTAAFAALGREIHEEWLRTNPEGMLRLLSVPCSTGEEPYSMAMALLDAGFPMNRFWVDAVDISERVLAQGRQGVYRENSFRGNALGFRDRYFTATAGGHRVLDAVRRHVHFRQGNVLSSTFLPGAAPYDVIFCRNVLIYFDRETQARTIDVLAHLLAPKGFLFVGAAEAGVFLNSDFVSAGIAMAMFRKAAARQGKPASRPARPIARSVARRSVPPPVPAVRPVRASAEASARQARAPSPSSDRPSEQRDGFDEARQLADQGRFVEAALRCEEHLRRYGPSAEAFHLLGLVRDASGNHLDASHCYRKALYLDPNHGEALMHLALLMEEGGRRAEALVLRNRMKRLEQQSRA